MATFADYLLNISGYTAQAVKQVEEAAAPKTRRPLPCPPPFYINKLQHSLPPETQRWVKSAADERAAVEHGCRFSERMGEYFIDWVESNCKLYEGDLAGHSVFLDDWQYETGMQTYGWLFFDEEWEAKRAGAGWVRRYVVVSGWIPKKNGKTPSLAYNGLYLFAGDGEQGQKCFSLATTRDQAALSHVHAVNFVRQSPALSSHCNVNATDLGITDRWTNSTYTILCGDKGGLTKSKEGINGSLFIDETHVVNRALMKVVGRAGISRRQPIQIQFSTAGADTAGYGFDQYTLGNDNLKAAEENRPFDFRFYHFEFAIPQTTSIDELRSPDKIDAFIRLANPTNGRIVRHTEARRDWQKSLRSDTELIEFAMYRLNQWNTGGGTYIAGSDWQRCKKHFSMEEVQDHPCVIGVDLSKISDMTAVVPVWVVPKVVKLPVDPFDPDSALEERELNVPYVLPYFWCPRRSVQQYAGKLDVKGLAGRKQLFITETPSIRIESIAEQINFLDSRFDVRGVAGDLYRSKQLAACLGSTHGWDTDTKMFLINQGAASISPAVEQIYHNVLSGEIVHNGNAVFDWQLGNITVVEDSNGNRRYQKPSHNDYRKIDGWAALANAYTVLMNEPDLYPGSTLSISLQQTKN